MKIETIKKNLSKYKRVVALGLAILIGGICITNTIYYSVLAGISTGRVDINYWNPNSGSMDFYNKKDRHALWKLTFSDGKAAICLDATKSLNSGRSGTIDEYVFADTQDFPTGISRDGAEMLGYAFKLGQIASGGENITNPYWYCICQALCWMIESKGGNVTWEDIEEWKIQTKELGTHLKLDYPTFCAAVDKYADEATRQLRPEAVSEFTSKYANEAPILTLDYDEDTGIWSKDFELIDYLEAVDKGFEQVWMQYFLDWDKAPARVGLEGKLTMEHKADGGRNWVHVEFNGDIEELKSAGPIPLHFEEGSDGALYTYSLESISIWNPDDSGQQHLLGGVKTTPWTVYMTFGGVPPEWEPTPGSYEVIVNTHQHDETFISNYNIELYKYDFETGKPLANSEFEILEKMDTSQFDDSVDHNGGNPDGTYPLDDLNFDKFKKIRDNTEKPTDDWQVCGT